MLSFVGVNGLICEQTNLHRGLTGDHIQNHLNESTLSYIKTIEPVLEDTCFILTECVSVSVTVVS